MKLHHHIFQNTLIAELWKVYNTLWKSLCTMYHDPDDINALSSVELNNCIQHYYEMPQYYLGSGDLHFLNECVRPLLSKYFTKKRMWLATVDMTKSEGSGCTLHMSMGGYGEQYLTKHSQVNNT